MLMDFHMHAQNISLVLCSLLLYSDSDSVVFRYTFGGGRRWVDLIWKLDSKMYFV